MKHLTWHLDVGAGWVCVLLLLHLVHQHVGVPGAVVAFTALGLSSLRFHRLGCGTRRERKNLQGSSQKKTYTHELQLWIRYTSN